MVLEIPSGGADVVAPNAITFINRTPCGITNGFRFQQGPLTYPPKIDAVRQQPCARLFPQHAGFARLAIGDFTVNRATV